MSPDIVMWMQSVQDHAASLASSANTNPSPPPPGDSVDIAAAVSSSAEATKAWLASERLSFKTILARADPSAEFKWRRDLEEGMAAEDPLHRDGADGGGGRCA